jgi:hypothetical protein
VNVLIITPEEKRAVQELVAFASAKENWFDPAKHKWVPGNRPEYRVQLTMYNVVFTWTVGDGKVHRHMSISKLVGPGLPDPMFAMTIATWCGFTGGEVADDVTVQPGPDWYIDVDREIPCAIFGQTIGPAV